MVPEEELIILDSHIICPRLDVFPSIHYNYISKADSTIKESRLYDKVFREQHGDQSEAMGDRLRQLASDREDTRVDVTDGDMIVAIVLPLMKRAHQLKEAGEQVFVDAGGNLDRSQARVFQFMAKTVCGGVPLGVVITNSEAQSTLEKGFALLRDMLPEGDLSCFR